MSNHDSRVRISPGAILLMPLALITAGCAGIKFHPERRDDGLTYFETKPYIFVAVDKACVSTATVVALPNKERSLTFASGYGSADLSVNLSSGMITSVGQKTDTKVPETMTAIGGLATAGILSNGKQVVCEPSATLYPITDGLPQTTKPVPFPKPKLVEVGGVTK
ncbi:hypothetical protein [Cupriavidus nantongensis]|uniref:hypothetical protein n=1 Tax=Cupriavidus nantongensis TaxID=1796606 RepID=UPI00358F5AB4